MIKHQQCRSVYMGYRPLCAMNLEYYQLSSSISTTWHDNNLKVNTSNYFIPHIRKQKKGSQFASFFMSDTWFWRKSPFWHHHFLPTCPHTSSVNNNSRWKSFSGLERWGFIWLSTSLCHHQQNFILPVHVKMLFGGAQLERLPLFHFQNLGFNYITLCTKSQTSIYAHSCIKCTFWLI